MTRLRRVQHRVHLAPRAPAVGLPRRPLRQVHDGARRRRHHVDARGARTTLPRDRLRDVFVWRLGQYSDGDGAVGDGRVARRRG